MQMSGLPLILVPFIPFRWLPLAVARALMNSLSLAAGFSASWLVASKIGPTHGQFSQLRLALLLNALLLITFPARFNFITGQPNLILMCLVTLILVTSDEGKQGIAAGILALFKTNYLLLLISFLKRWRGGLALAVGVLTIGLVVSLSAFNPQGTSDFIAQRGPSFVVTKAETTDVDYYNQSLRVTMGRFKIGQYYPVVYAVLMLGSLVYLYKSGDVMGGGSRLYFCHRLCGNTILSWFIRCGY